MSGMTKLETSHKQVRIDELVWKIYEKLEARAKEKNSSIKILLQVTKPSLLEIPGNETLLYLALYNIVENAIKYSYDQPVVLRLSEKGDQLCIEISDQGRGIPSDDLVKIAETFYRGKNVDSIKGSGIGLSLSKSIFDHHHIAMNIDSVVNKGTTVTLIFPAHS